VNRSTRLVAVAVAIGWLAVGCGDDSEDASDGSSSTSTTEATTTDGSATTGSSAAPGTEPEGDSGADPGEPIEGVVPAGASLAVIGVGYDDVLNIRSAPGTDNEVVQTAGPTADGLVATGAARRLPNSIWFEVTYEGVTGWAGSAFLGYLGGTDDATAEVLAAAPRPTGDTVRAVGEAVASAFATTDPESRVVESVAATEGDVGEVTFDVVGVGDDSVAGYRLHVFTVPEGDGHALRTLERTLLCSRGVSGELCV